MKKIVCCLLSVYLLTGCSQLKQDPLVAQKIPEINNQDLHNIKEASLRRQFLQNPNKETKGNEYLYVLDKVELNRYDEYALINNSTNEYYNWITTYDTSKEIKEHLYLDLQGDFANELNQQFDEFFKIETGGFTTLSISGWAEQFDDILSLSVRKRSFAGGGMYKSEAILIYNIDLTDNQPLTNEQLLSRYGLDFKQAQTIINQQLEKDHIDICSDEVRENCCYDEEIYSMYPIIISSITNDSKLFIDEKGNLCMFFTVINPTIAMYDGEVTNYYVIQLTK